MTRQRIHMKAPTREAILERTEEFGDCLIWTGPYSSVGVPVCFVDGTRLPVRRVLLELAGRKVPGRMVLGVKCGDPRCVCEDHTAVRSRTDHLRHMTRVAIEQPTHTVNRTLARRARSKLTMQAAETIRAMDGTLEQIGRAFDVSTQTVHRIKNNKAWVSNPFGGPAGLMR